MDLFRIALALLVLLFHSHTKNHLGCYYYFFDDFIGMGAIAMTAFFMLSGYSLSIVYGKEEFISIESINTFYKKRFVSIAPIYFFVTILFLFAFNQESILHLICLLPVEFLTLQSEFDLFHVFHNGGTWFISCLTICYFLFPFIQRLTTPITSMGKIKMCVILSLLILLAPFVGKSFDVETYSNPFVRLLEFWIGIILFQVNSSELGGSRVLDIIRSKSMLMLSIVALIGGVTLVIRLGFPKSYQAYNIIALPCFVVMLLSLASNNFKIMNEKLILYLSKLSYPFFMTQIFLWPVCKWLIELIGNDSNGIKILVSLIMCTVISILMYELIDKPFSKILKKKLFCQPLG